MSQVSDKLENRILATLATDAEYSRLVPHLEKVSLESKQVIYQPSDRPAYVYFPMQAMVSLVAVMESGASVEVALVGREGVVSPPVLLGNGVAALQAIVQIAGDAVRVNTDVLKSELFQGGTLLRQILLYNQALFLQIAQGAVCNRLHTIEQRLARWLLSVQDGIQADDFYLTQEFIAEMIGIRRSSVTVAAGTLQQLGAIRYARGRITILDRQLLKESSCDCYHIIQQHYNRILGDGHSSLEDGYLGY